MKILWSLSALAFASVAVLGMGRAPAPVPLLDPSRPAPLPPDAVWDLLAARPFRVAEPFTDWWRKEHGNVRAGHILVLAVDPEAFVPRQTLEPVLQVGLQTAERMNDAHRDGILVVLVPSPAGPDGWPTRDLASDPIFLGSPALPEEVDAAHLEAELARTRVLPFGRARVEAALRNGGAALDARDRVDVVQAAARWIAAYAPSEAGRAASLLVPYKR